MQPAQPLPAVLSRLQPSVGEQWPFRLSYPQVEALVMRAIHEGALAEAAEAILDLDEVLVAEEGRALAEIATQTCTAIAEGNESEQDRLITLLRDAGVASAQPQSLADKERTQFNAARIMVRAEDVPATLELLRAQGYAYPDHWYGAVLNSILRVRSSLVIERADDLANRLTLHWQTRNRSPGWLRRLQPGEPDYRLVALPGSLWPLYHAIKPFRVLLSRVSGEAKVEGPYLGTPPALIPALLTFAEVSENDVVMDLGCGDGRVILEAARLCGCSAVGYELDQDLASRARAAARETGLESTVDIREEDFISADVSEASVVFLFLPPELLSRILPDLLKRLRPRSRIVAHEQLPLQVDSAPDRSRPLFAQTALTVAHLWQVP